jgi:hypothetical protein
VFVVFSALAGSGLGDGGTLIKSNKKIKIKHD